MEAFWAMLKREITWITGIETFDTRTELRTAVFDYIEVFYNQQRHQTGLGNLTPNEYEQEITAA
jgi:transposase InsO family protein